MTPQAPRELAAPSHPSKTGGVEWWPMRRFLSQPFEPVAAPIWGAWLGLTVLSISLAFLEARFDWSGMPFSIAGRTLGFSIYPPVAISACIAFWLGPTYGATTAYVSTLVSGLAG